MPSKSLPDKQAFYFLLQEKGIEKRLGKSKSRISHLRDEIDRDIYPSAEVMEEYLIAAGWKVVQERKWNIKN